MFNIADNGIVTVNRGDSFELPIVLKIGSALEGKTYELTPSDIVYLGIMEPNQPFETALVRKKLTYSDLQDPKYICFRFWPEDTCCLCPGKYYYQVKIQTIDEATQRHDVETIIDKTLFYIRE